MTYFVFDVLDVDGESVRTLPYTQRRALLEGLGVADGRRVQVPPTMTGIDGETLMGIAADNGIEGVVAKKAESVYRSGIRSPSWIKVPIRNTREGVICGWVPTGGRAGGTLAALLLGAYDETGELVYIGPCRNGFHRSNTPRTAEHTHRAHPSGQCAARSDSPHRRSRSVLGDTGIGGDRGIPRTIDNGTFTASRIQRHSIRHGTPRRRDMKGCSSSPHSLVTLAVTRVPDIACDRKVFRLWPNE